MTNQELKLECYKAVGPKSVGRLEEAKDLYEWVSQNEEVKEKGFTFKGVPPVEVELSPDQKNVVASLRDISQHSNLEEYLEDWVKKLVEVSQPKGEGTFEPTIQTDDTKIKISYEGSMRIIEVETGGEEITIGGNNSFSCYHPGSLELFPRDIPLDERQTTITDKVQNITYKLTFI